MPSVILSGFADESAFSKRANEQLAALAAVGLRHYSVRFVDLGNGIKNIMALDDAELQTLQDLNEEYGFSISSIGSPIGKTKLLDVEDGTNNSYKPFEQYLAQDVVTACDRAEAFDCKLLRGFSFYHPKGTPAETHLPQVIDQLGQIAAACDARGLTFGLEVEANLVGQSGELLAQIARGVNHPAMVTIFDGANLVMQGFTTEQVFQQYEAMKPSMGWMHIKDYKDPSITGRVEHVDEDAAHHFVPAHQGDSGHAAILADFVTILPELESRMKARGCDGVYLDLEPHLRGGGQFGGFSGPDGFGVAARSLCGLLNGAGIDYQLRSFEAM